MRRRHRQVTQQRRPGHANRHARHCDGELLTSTEKTDLLLVALLELAPSDTRVRELAALQLSRLEDPAALVLGERLVERAGVTPSSETVTDDTTREVTP